MTDVSPVRTLEAEERAWYAQSFNDGDCEYTLELTAVRPRHDPGTVLRVEKAEPVVLVIRDPDFSNEFVVDGEAEIIDVDTWLGLQRSPRTSIPRAPGDRSGWPEHARRSIIWQPTAR